MYVFSVIPCEHFYLSKWACTTRQWYCESSSAHKVIVSSWFCIGVCCYFRFLFLFSQAFLLVFSPYVFLFIIYAFLEFLLVVYTTSYTSLKIMRSHMVRQFYDPLQDGYLNRKLPLIEAVGKFLTKCGIPNIKGTSFL